MKATLAVYGMSVVDWLKSSQSKAGVDVSCVLLLPDSNDPQDCFMMIVTNREIDAVEMKARHGQCLEAMALTYAKMTSKEDVLNCVSRAFSLVDGCAICEDAFDDLDRTLQ